MNKLSIGIHCPDAFERDLWRCRHFLWQLVECTYLRKLHDLHGSEAHASDCVLLTPSGLETAICIKVQQLAMHCDALSAETKLV